jgi:protein-S-isoprenylcysteine O-methyltransferase Ste14
MEDASRALIIRAAGLYLPLAAAFFVAFCKPRAPRLFAACLLGFCWTLPSLLVVQLFNLKFGWWTFHASGGLFRGMPLDLFLGWAVLWGVLPALGFRRIASVWVIALFVVMDLMLMPMFQPVVDLGGRWLIGEGVAVCVVLIPAQLLARWTFTDTHLEWRAAMQVVTSSGLFLLLIPEVALALRPGRGWEPLWSTPRWPLNLELQGIGLLGVMGVSAVQEFARRGGGTPIPYDPPKRLVISGMYRYIANPMQMSCALVTTAWGGMLRNPWVIAAGVMSFIYGLGSANSDECADLRRRFGSSWVQYREHVHAWRFRLKPWHDPLRPVARMYVAETCGPCSEVRRWFEKKGAIALQIVAAEDHPSRDLERITYDPMDGCDAEEGVRAIARGLEHIHLGWALAGVCLRLPGIAQVVQLLVDVSGFGPRTTPRRSGLESHCRV